MPNHAAMRSKNARSRFVPLFLLLNLGLLPLVAFGAADGKITSINVGNAEISVPVPPGFAPVTKEMKLTYQLQQQFVAPMNQLFLGFIAEGEVGTAMTDELPSLNRTCTIQALKQLVGQTVTKSQFAELKKELKSQNEKLISKMEKEIPGAMKKINDGITKEFGVNVGLELGKMVPLPVHEETERTMASSMYVKYEMGKQLAKATSFVGVVTATYAHVKGKLLFLYCNGQEQDLQWSRTTSKAWADALIAANPGGVESNRRETSGGFGSRVLRYALVGAIAGGIFGLIRSAFRRKPARDDGAAAS